MSRTLTISDTLYERLAAEARAEGVSSVERYLEERLSGDVLSRRAPCATPMPFGKVWRPATPKPPTASK